MLTKPKVSCRHPGCPELVDAGKKYCEKHKPLHREEIRSAGSRGYGRAWQRASRQYLAAHPPLRPVIQSAVGHVIADRDLNWNPPGRQDI